jgi:hypothetical protein
MKLYKLNPSYRWRYWVQREGPLNEEWRQALESLRDWRWINTSDGLWDTRMWVKPG